MAMINVYLYPVLTCMTTHLLAVLIKSSIDNQNKVMVYS